MQSTKDSDNHHIDFFPQKIKERTNEFFVGIIDPIDQTKFKSPSRADADLTGRFPYVSSRGNQYLVVMYDYDTNSIVFQPIKIRQSKEIYIAFKNAKTLVTWDKIGRASQVTNVH